MLGSITTIVLFCVLVTVGATDEKLKRIQEKLNLTYTKGGYGEEDIDHHLATQTAKFNISGKDTSLRVMKNKLLLYTCNTQPYWLKSDQVQVVVHFVEGSTPLKVTQLHADGKLTVKYLGSITDERCTFLNCHYEIVQPVGTVMKKELLDVTGWALLNVVNSPYIPNGGMSFVSDSNLRCRLN